MSRILPILFNTEMVQAILEGRKSVTRRIVKHDTGALLNSPYRKTHPEVPDKQIIAKLCVAPYEVGDILYVRETWNICSMWSSDNRVTFVYRADEDEEKSARTISVSDEMFDKFGKMMHGSSPEWRPSIHMPKEVARIFLKVKDVRVERLQDITEKQAEKEGFIDTAEYCVGNTAKGHFRNPWDSTIKKADIDKYGWYANPWVWVIEFERCEKPEEWDNGKS